MTMNFKHSNKNSLLTTIVYRYQHAVPPIRATTTTANATVTTRMKWNLILKQAFDHWLWCAERHIG